jgi:xanthine dehydrogenase accessory factor
MEPPFSTKDPVCMMKIDIVENPVHSDFRNRRYYFCSTACRRAFDQDPDRYLRLAA